VKAPALRNTNTVHSPHAPPPRQQQGPQSLYLTESFSNFSVNVWVVYKSGFAVFIAQQAKPETMHRINIFAVYRH
tara:strand:- start:204 stop:428 length:225 start_codon:yes stop_codon:yes gene_type:complete